MAILKKGSTGSAVESLQAKLNKAGAKPKLKDDGIFGPLTDKAVRAFQKKTGLKADGKVDEYTLATIKFGGKLPEMKVRDYVKRQAQFESTWEFNKMNINSYMAIEREAAKLADVATKEVPIARGLFVENHKKWLIIAGLGKTIISNQAEFAKLLTKEPARAAKLAKECENLDKKIEAIGSSTINPNLTKALASLKITKKKIESTVSLIQAEMAEISKRKEEF